MEMTGEQLIPLPQQETWSALNDIEVLKACIPGCETIELLSPTEYQLSMVAKVGPVNAKFKGKMTLSDVNPPDSYSLLFEGQGGVAGFAKGQATVKLVPDAEGTRLGYSVKAMVGGKLAQVGARLIDGVAKKMADQFFTSFNAHVSGKQEAGSGDQKQG
jgi:carbon monoxide dehydrogenase subunit G